MHDGPKRNARLCINRPVAQATRAELAEIPRQQLHEMARFRLAKNPHATILFDHSSITRSMDNIEARAIVFPFPESGFEPIEVATKGVILARNKACEEWLHVRANLDHESSHLKEAALFRERLDEYTTDRIKRYDPRVTIGRIQKSHATDAVVKLIERHLPETFCFEPIKVTPDVYDLSEYRRINNPRLSSFAAQYIPAHDPANQIPAALRSALQSSLGQE